MKIYIFFICLTFLLLLNIRCFAQDNDSGASFVLQKPYVIDRVPQGMQWTVQPKAPDSTNASGAPKSSPVCSLTTVKEGQFVVRRQTRDDGTVWNTWCTGDMQILVWPDQKKWIIATPSKKPGIPSVNYVDYSKSDFPELEWISDKNFVGLEKYNDIDCIKFSASIRLAADEDPTPLTVYINKDTRYPLAIIRPEGAFEYSFAASSTSESAPLIVIKLLDGLTKQQSFGRDIPSNN